MLCGGWLTMVPGVCATVDYLSYLYTPQQMSGGASFGHSTRVGNWSEDYELQQHRIKVRPRSTAFRVAWPRRAPRHVQPAAA